MFPGLWAILGKEIIHIRRDPATRLVLAIPPIQLLLFGVFFMLLSALRFKKHLG